MRACARARARAFAFVLAPNACPTVWLHARGAVRRACVASSQLLGRWRWRGAAPEAGAAVHGLKRNKSSEASGAAAGPTLHPRTQLTPHTAPSRPRHGPPPAAHLDVEASRGHVCRDEHLDGAAGEVPQRALTLRLVGATKASTQRRRRQRQQLQGRRRRHLRTQKGTHARMQAGTQAGRLAGHKNGRQRQRRVRTSCRRGRWPALRCSRASPPCISSPRSCRTHAA